MDAWTDTLLAMLALPKFGLGTVFVVVEGQGSACVDNKTIALQARDTLVVPSWRELILQADTDLVLFGYSDRTAQEKLGLFREHRG